MRSEHSRKHGAFDPRYPRARHRPDPEGLWGVGQVLFDWRGFLARFFPESRRHDGIALAAYESYRNHVESGIASSRTTQRRDEDEAAARVDTDRWEGEGGASAEAPRPRGKRRRRVATRWTHR